MRRLCWTLSLLLTVGLFAPPAAAQNQKLVMEEFVVPAKDPGLQLYVRNKRPEGMTQFSPEKTIVYVHGATYPSETAFDLPLAGVLDGPHREPRFRRVLPRPAGVREE